MPSEKVSVIGSAFAANAENAKDPRRREAVLFSYENLRKGGHLLVKTISIGDTDSSGVRYEEVPMSKRGLQLIDQRLQEVLEQHSS